MQINSNNEIAKINPALNNKVEEKPSSENKNDKVSGYAEKSAAPANSNYYMAMYGVKNTKTEEKAEAKANDDDAKYRKAMGEYLEKYGTPEQIKEFNAQKAEAKTEAQPTDEDASYKKAMGEYLEKWGSPEKIKEFKGEETDYSKYKVDVNVEDIKIDVPKEEPKPEKFEYKPETTGADDDAKYRKAMGEYLEKYGTPEQIKEFNSPKAEAKTEAQPTAEDASYKKAMAEYLEKWGSPEKIKEFKGEETDYSKYKVDVNVEDIKINVPKEEPKPEKFEYKSETTGADDDAKYRKAMGEYLEKWGSPEQLKEFYGEADKKATTSTPTSELPSPDEVKFETEEDKKYYEQYLEYKHKYE